MKTYAPKGLHGAQLRELIADLGNPTPAVIAKFLQVTERSVWRWLSDDSAPYAALALLWHETPTGRYNTATDVGNEAMYLRGERNAFRTAMEQTQAQMGRVLAISDTGAANSPIYASTYAEWQPHGSFLSEAPQPCALGFDRDVSALFAR